MMVDNSHLQTAFATSPLADDSKITVKTSPLALQQQNQDWNKHFAQVAQGINDAIGKAIKECNGTTSYVNWNRPFSEIGFATKEAVAELVNKVCDSLGIQQPQSPADANTPAINNACDSICAEAKSPICVRDLAASHCSTPEQLRNFLFGIQIGGELHGEGRALTLLAGFFTKASIRTKVEKVLKKVIAGQQNEADGYSSMLQDEGTFAFTNIAGLDSMEVLDFDLMLDREFGFQGSRFFAQLYLSLRETHLSNSAEVQLKPSSPISLDEIVDSIYDQLARQGRARLG
jgi:acyl carrier protein